MTDTEQANEEVTADSGATAAGKATKKARKKTVRKSSDTVAESVVENVTEQEAAAPAVEAAVESSGQEDKRAKLVNKLKAMGMMPGSTTKAATEKSATAGIKGLDLTLPTWLSPQLLAVTAGAGIFAILIWSLQQEKQAQPQQAARPAQQVYNPYAMAPPPGPYPMPAPQTQNQVEPTAQDRTQAMSSQPRYYAPPVYNPYAMAPPPRPYPTQPVQKQAEQAKQAEQDTQQTNPNRPPQAVWYPNAYGYGYHPSMRFGVNGYMQGRGNAAPYYYANPQQPPGHAYPPQPAAGQQRK